MRSARTLFRALVLLGSAVLLSSTVLVCAGQSGASPEPIDRSHDSPEWANIAAHLPDPATASPARLEQTGDVLRARRYPEDAVQFYLAALSRGGDPVSLLKKTGIVCMEMQQIALARAYFGRAIRLDKRNAGAWNNLAASEFLLGDRGGAIHDYKRAIRYDKHSAVFHSNLALVYFEAGSVQDGRRELSRAFALDPDLLQHQAEHGDTARVLSSANYSEICFEMARIYAAQGNLDAVLDWLTKASERGYNVRHALDADPALRPLLADARIKVLLNNADTLRAGVKRPANVPPSLGPAADGSNR